MSNISKEVAEQIIAQKAETREEIENIKKTVAKKHGTSFPTNISILKEYRKLTSNKDIVPLPLVTRPVRSLSGVVNISVLTKPYPCPGECTYCPSEKDLPKSYLPNEPAVMRAILNNYHPQKQVKMRIRALEEAGHPTEKIEIRVVGGTWSYYSKKYKYWFIKNCFDACNGEKSETLKEAQQKNEEAKHRIVCLSVETRPDYVDKEEVKRLRILGVTMVELGVQSLSDEVLNFTKRGHGIKETIKATKILKDAGFKICYQVMPGLPKSDPEKDIKMFEEMFSNPSFRPDFLKIYPCLVIKNTALYPLWKSGEYKAYDDKTLIDIITKVKKDIIPYYVRIQRLFRDVPVQEISGGCKISNLREIFKESAKNNKWQCRCIRCREVRDNYNTEENILLFREDYAASDGTEIFLSFENKERNKLYALLRLRVSKNNIFPFLKDKALIREIRTYGKHLPIKEKDNKSPQHKGLGKKLIKEAEEVVKNEFKIKHIAVISGVGVRGYWKNLGYKLEKTYMTIDL